MCVCVCVLSMKKRCISIFKLTMPTPLKQLMLFYAANRLPYCLSLLLISCSVAFVFVLSVLCCLSKENSASNISGHCSLQARSKMTLKDKTC